jgi:hypothetical protein
MKDTALEIISIFSDQGYGAFSAYLLNTLPADLPESNLELLIELGAFLKKNKDSGEEKFPGKGFVDMVIRSGKFPEIEESRDLSPSHWRNALDKFERGGPDFMEIYRLCLSTLIKTPTADAFNLAGRCLELAGHAPASALTFYGQAYSMNPKHPYAGDNIRRILDQISHGN